ncbi:hypothetical protein GCM10010246_77200 [Streptomyces cuspidosporus]|uniref:Uncharacterized protein n=1 Tax=Streptomyces cuspidosporus TaxID=66882 RepID=A0ABN3H7G2_9ACTN
MPGLCKHSGFGLVEESETYQAFEFRAGAFDMLGHQRQVQREAQIVGAWRAAIRRTAGITASVLWALDEQRRIRHTAVVDGRGVRRHPRQRTVVQETGICNSSSYVANGSTTALETSVGCG